MNVSKKTILLSAISFILGQYSVANAAEVHEKKPSASSSMAAKQTPARQASIDPVTGELRSQGDTAQKTAAQTVQIELPPIKYITHPDGTVEGDLNGWFQSNLNVTIKCDGELKTQHSDQNAEPRSRCEESE